jgi:hypothetical protein
MADKLIMWDKLMRALELVSTTDTIPDKTTRCLSAPQIHGRLSSCVRRAVTRIDTIVAQQFECDANFAEFEQRIKEANLQVTVIRLPVGQFNHGRITTPKGFILYG